MKERKKNLLIITSSGGGGHIQAARAKACEALSLDPNVCIIQRDILLDWVKIFFVRFFLHLYDSSMKKGKVHVQERIVKFQGTLDFFFWPLIFLKAFIDLIRYDVDQIIDTQPLGTSAIIKAIRLVSYWKKKPLILEKIITELPTEKVTHFFKPIKRLSDKDRLILQVVSAKPLDNQQSAETFWQKNCKLSENKINYDLLPLRPSFHQYLQKDPHTELLIIPIQLTHETEKNLVLETIQSGNIEAKCSALEIQFTVHPDENVFTLMLGSHPAEKATLKYIENFIDVCSRPFSSDKKNHLFVFCGNFQTKNKSLMRRIHDLVKQVKNYPSNLTIIPIPFQSDAAIAPLFSRSNATFTRSGGLTSLELMSVAKGQIWIHSEINNHIRRFRKKHSESMLTGMLSWEQGNAFYLQCVKGAKIISPDTLPQALQAYYS